MTRERDPEFDAWVADARSADIIQAFTALGRGNLRRSGAEQVGPCPLCGGQEKRGSDRFAINPREGVFHCRGTGQGGDVIAMVQHVEACDFLAACEILTRRPPPRGEGQRLSEAERETKRQESAAEREKLDAAEAQRAAAERARLYDMWRRAEPFAGTLVEDYLRHRRVMAPPSAALRFIPQAKFYAFHGDKPVAIHTGPAMLAAILGPDGRFSGTHTTWIDLSRENGRAAIVDPLTGEVMSGKKVRGRKIGGRIELHRVNDPTRLIIGEGIESVLSVYADMIERGRDLSRSAFWSSVDLGNLGGRAAATVEHPTATVTDGQGRKRPASVPGPVPDFDSPGIPIPDSVIDVVTLGDGDSDPVLTEYAHRRAARRWHKEGRIIRAAFAPADKDFNNLRQERRA